MKVQIEDSSSELCPVWGDCRLQDLAYRYQVSAEHFAATTTRYPMETTNPFIVRDFSRCIQCGRCVQACTEIQVNNAISFGYRGAQSKVIAAGDRPLKDSDCVFCGECVQVCPVGALVEKDARHVLRPWQSRRIRTTCSYCGVGCQMHLHVKENKVVKVTGVDAPPNHGSLCVKGRFGYHFITSPRRLTHPLIKEDGRFCEASWDEALNRVADRLANIRDAHGSESIGVLSSARMTNEDNYMAQKFARAVIKTNNVDHKEKRFDQAFIEARTEDFEKLEKSLEKYTPSFVESITGIAADRLATAARIYARAGAGNIVYCMGITQHSTGTDNVKALANLAMLCGNLGIVVGGVNPLRGQNNVQVAVAAGNRLTNGALDPVCAIPELKVCAVAVAPAANNPEEARL